LRNRLAARAHSTAKWNATAASRRVTVPAAPQTIRAALPPHEAEQTMTTTKEPESLLKATAQAALIGLTGAAAMFATELLLFPDFVSAEQDAVVEAACESVPQDECSLVAK
jgi:hypothetical protein